LESELFGHVKGSFSGALSAKPGLFEIAHQGTLFLDEVCNLTLETQGKLLRFLESGEFRPVGGVTVKRVQFRLVTATNRKLEQMVAEGTFRSDLFFRLNVVPIELPPLRDRPTDIVTLIEHFLHARIRTKPKGIGPQRFSSAALELLQHYSWPGNVRELKNLVDRLMIMVEENTIRVEHLPDHMIRPSSPPAVEIPRTNVELKAMKRALRERMFVDIEYAFVVAALRRNDWNVSRAARETGLLRPNFHALMRKHKIRAKPEDHDKQ
ncbi:MAG: sigma-54-dependent Fis family transcriptional regulator, partial [Lentisphaeria bacterium]|nr:sigma-54-dependent Fis family transcriptional regulator [Lentisphaeria bacterium]